MPQNIGMDAVEANEFAKIQLAQKGLADIDAMQRARASAMVLTAEE